MDFDHLINRDDPRESFRSALTEMERAHEALLREKSDATLAAYAQACLLARRAFDRMTDEGFEKARVRK